MKLKSDRNTLTVDGPIKSGHEYDFADALEDHIKEYPTSAIVDLTDSPFINSAALGIMLNCSRETKNALKFRIKEGSEIEHMIEITKLRDVLNIEWVPKEKP